MSVRSRYMAAVHAIQTGTAMELARDPHSGTPKHLRVGVNTGKCEHAALVRLLIEKGLFTEEEYALAIVEELEREVVRYEERLSSQLGSNVKLG